MRYKTIIKRSIKRTSKSRKRSKKGLRKKSYVNSEGVRKFYYA